MYHSVVGLWYNKCSYGGEECGFSVDASKEGFWIEIEGGEEARGLEGAGCNFLRCVCSSSVFAGGRSDKGGFANFVSVAGFEVVCDCPRDSWVLNAFRCCVIDGSIVLCLASSAPKPLEIADMRPDQGFGWGFIHGGFPFDLYAIV